MIGSNLLATQVLVMVDVYGQFDYIALVAIACHIHNNKKGVGLCYFRLNYLAF